jgi:hypothetical protein
MIIITEVLILGIAPAKRVELSWRGWLFGLVLVGGIGGVESLWGLVSDGRRN